MNANRPGTEKIFVVDYTARTLTMPFPKNPSDRSYDQIHRDVSRIQWFAIGNGGEQKDEKIVFRFEQLDELNSCLRYLGRFEWKQGENCPTCSSLLVDPV